MDSDISTPFSSCVTPVQKAQPRPYFHGSLRSASVLIFVVPDLEERTSVLSSAAGKLPARSRAVCLSIIPMLSWRLVRSNTVSLPCLSKSSCKRKGRPVKHVRVRGKLNNHERRYTIRAYPKMWAPIAGKVGVSAAEK